MNRRVETVGRPRTADAARPQLITLAVDPHRERGEGDPVRPVLACVRGVHAVEPDPASIRVWVYGDGNVEPDALIDALAAWGFGAYLLRHERDTASVTGPPRRPVDGTRAAKDRSPSSRYTCSTSEGG